MFAKVLKYGTGSIVAALTSQVVLVLSYGVFHLFGSRGSAILATLCGAVPSYIINRRWTWKKRTKSSLSREVIPFLIISLIGLAFSTFTADFASSHREVVGSSKLLQVLFVDAGYFAAYAILWVGKFLVFDRILFVGGEDDVDASASN